MNKIRHIYCFVAAILSLILFISCFPVSVFAVTKEAQVQATVDKYYSAVCKVGIPHWNANHSMSTLMKNADAGDYAADVTPYECLYPNGHSPKKGTCDSNHFSGEQCFGFAKYMCYVVFGNYPAKASGQSIAAGTDKNWIYIQGDSFPNLQAGDMLRYWYYVHDEKTGELKLMAHAYFIYSNNNGKIRVIDCNQSGKAGGKCIIELRQLSDSKLKTIKGYWANGTAYVCRNKTVGTIDAGNPPTNVTVVTDTVTELTATGARLNGHFVSSQNVHITEHGAYMGTDPNNMSLVARDTVNYNRSSLTMFYRTSKYYGDILPGTTYYYKQYVIADGKTYWGEVRSFTTDGKVSCSISGEAYNISDKSASLRITTSLSSPGDIIISALRFGTSPDALHTLEQININQHTDQHVLERDLSEYNLTIEPNKTYYFAASVVVNGRVNVSDIFRFTTPAVIPEDTSEGGPDEEIIPPPEAPIITLSSNTIYVGQTATVQWNSVPNSNHYSLIVSGPVSVISEMNGNETWSELSDLTEGTYSINVWASGVGGSSPKSNTLTLTVLPVVITHHVFTKPATNITATSAQFNGSFSSDAKPHMTEHGVYMGTDPVTMEKVAVDKVDYYKSSLTMFYSTSKYYGTLMPDTTYYYCEYVVVDGVELRGETLSFKTSPPSGNIRYGVVHVNSGALAINDAPRASNNGSNPSKQIGRIPNGQTCIVDLSRTSGNWYWVTYNGVSGYAYKSYISLQ